MHIAAIVTPNLPELTALEASLNPVRAELVEALSFSSGVEAEDSASTGSARAGLGLARQFEMHVLAKGGHGGGADITDILFGADGEIARWSAPRIATTSTHGTGCTLASAIATGLGAGLTMTAAIDRARTFVRLALRDAPGLGGGHGPMAQQAVRLDVAPDRRINQITLPAGADADASVAFYTALGLRQIVATDHGYARFEAPGGMTLSVETGASATTFLECNDLDATLTDLAARGIGAVEGPTDQPWSWREARLRDPAGNAVCLYQAGENRRFPPWRLPDA